LTLDERTLEVAIVVAKTLHSRGVETAVIGAVAAAVRNYPRATQDLDLATFTVPSPTLGWVRDDLKAQGFEAELTLPDADDPLGGVLRITGAGFGLIEVVNFYNPMGKIAEVGRLAIDEAEPNVLGTLAVVRLPHLIALKLYAATGIVSKAHLDVMELLDRNPEIDIAALRELCERLGLGRELEAVLERR